MYHVCQRSPTTGPLTGTGPWVICYQAAQKKTITLFPLNGLSESERRFILKNYRIFLLLCGPLSKKALQRH